MFNRCVLIVIFTLSFATYLFGDVSTSFQLLPIAAFAVLVVVRVFGHPARTAAALQSLFSTDAAVFILGVILLTAAPSLLSKYELSPDYWIMMSTVLVLSRMYMAVTPIEEVLTAFFWSGVLCLAIFLFLGFNLLFQSIETLKRFSPFSFHPNLLAFILAGYICIFVVKALEAKAVVRVLALAAAAASAVIIFFASSRGSIVALICGFGVVGAVGVFRAQRQRRRSLAKVAGITICVSVAAGLFLAYSPWTSEAFDFVNKVLQLTQDYRGLDSGLSGRLDRWDMVIGVFSNGTFLLGKGLRFTDTLYPMIDNSYLILLYELGLIPAVLITWRFISMAWRVTVRYLHSHDPEQERFYRTITLLIVAFLVNNIVARYLLGMGNPYSFLLILLFSTGDLSQRRASFPAAVVWTHGSGPAGEPRRPWKRTSAIPSVNKGVVLPGPAGQ